MEDIKRKMDKEEAALEDRLRQIDETFDAKKVEEKAAEAARNGGDSGIPSAR